MSGGDLGVGVAVTRTMAEEEPELLWDSTNRVLQLTETETIVVASSRPTARPWEINRAGVYPPSACPS